MLRHPIGRLRAVGLLEGASFLILLGIAMPLKYFADMPLAVKIVGWIHGMLFVLYVIALLQAWVDRSWKITRAIVLFGASLVPFGTFVADRSLKREQEAEA